MTEIDMLKAEILRLKTEIERMKECPKCVYEYDGEVIEYCIQGPCSHFVPNKSSNYTK